MLLHFLLLLLLLLLPSLFDAKVNREEVYGIPGSSVLLDPKIKVDHSKKDIIWEFIPARRSAITILHHIRGVELVEPSDHFKSRLQYTPSNASLMVKGLGLEDQGEYRLTINDQVVKIIQLYLFDELKEALISTNSTSLGSTIQLTCNVSGNVDEYQWWKDGGEISRHHQLIDQNRSLVIPGASRRDCGTYTCVATNPANFIQKNHTQNIYGFPPLELTIIILSIIDVVMYSASLITCLYLHCWKTKLDKALKRSKCWLQDTFQITFKDMKKIRRWLPDLRICNIVSLVAILCWITIQGVNRVLVAGLCSVLVQLLALILPFAVQKLPEVEKIGCDSSLTTWGIFFTSRIGCVVIFILHSVFLHCKSKDTSGNIDTDKGQQDITELEQLKTTIPDDPVYLSPN
ncbi:uncharacterized protein LOC116990216 isoform X2 [Amblyraja radiata]|uniref:uncharacterized protein LOC116990216 isoform X2 n=1 Tax=Amblyraja radiata TaxID=386614 RepID=UPI001402B636|nr:uncharacterized protein LOC116990216 isoform X2 [Amblyraja radiata]